jgi:hypothetical protein
MPDTGTQRKILLLCCHFEKDNFMPAPSFDDRDGFIWLDGALVDWRDAKVHVLSHALHYASSVFEGVRSYGGNIFKLTEHSQRLINSAALLGFEIPYSLEEINNACIETCKANNIVNGYLRPVAWRGSEMMAISNLDMALLFHPRSPHERHPSENWPVETPLGGDGTGPRQGGGPVYDLYFIETRG